METERKNKEMQTDEIRRYEKAIRRLKEYFDRARYSDAIRDPVAWSLYQVWKEADENEF